MISKSEVENLRESLGYVLRGPTSMANWEESADLVAKIDGISCRYSS